VVEQRAREARSGPAGAVRGDEPEIIAMPRPKRRRLVLVEWIDSHSAVGGWQPLDEIAAAAEAVHCRSVGWLVSDRNGVKVLVAHISGDRNGVRPYGKGDIAIPSRCITKIRVLAER
jgi:hypothetical protein